MKITYPAIIEHDEEAMYATFPDLEGCFTYGDNLGELMVNAKEALTGYLLALMESHIPLPSPSAPSSLAVSADSFIALIQSDVDTIVAEKEKTLMQGE